MSCCGGKTLGVKSTDVQITMVKAMFTTPNEASEQVYGTTYLLGNRVINYKRHRDGDIFNVAVQDIRSRPDRFISPCGKPFDFDKNGGIINPCEDEPVVEETEYGESLTDIPGVGVATSRKFAEAGIFKQEQVAQLSDTELVELGVPPMSRKKIREWTQSK